jgi:O-antigen/teichoic acid export membrane protein
MLTTLANNLMLPYYSRLRHNSSRPLPLTLRGHTIAGIFAWALAAELVLASGDVIKLLYRGPYEEAGLMAPIIAIVSWFQMLQSLGGAILFAHGRAQSGAVVNALKLSAMVVLVPLGIHFGGLEGLLWAFAMAEFARYLFTVYAVRRVGLRLWWSDLVLTATLGLVFVAAELNFIGSLGWVHSLAEGLAARVAWTAANDRALLLVRLAVESGGVVLAALSVLAVYWVCFHHKFAAASEPEQAAASAVS